MESTRKKVKTTRSRTGCLTCRKRKKKCDETSYPICQNCQSKSLECSWPQTKHELHKKLEEVKYIDEDGRDHRNSLNPVEPTMVDEKPIDLEDLNNSFQLDLVSNHIPIGSTLIPTRSPIIPSKANANLMVTSPNTTSKFSRDMSKIRRPESADNLARHMKRSHKPAEMKKTSKSFSGAVRPHGYFLEKIAMQQDCVEGDEINKQSMSSRISKTSEVPSSNFGPSLDFSAEVDSGMHQLDFGLINELSAMSSYGSRTSKLQSENSLFQVPSSTFTSPSGYSPRSLNPTLSTESKYNLSSKSPTPELSGDG
ncbi:uncharacterized protein RJT20DRAFT_134090 [Scheffersomyces xylosifermentans]|uniref:uncharacterized protein n=1 Tax=Scheffersomyces xylosifermentans TaxID=1304137 RepID=UPI00315D1EA7